MISWIIFGAVLLFTVGMLFSTRDNAYGAPNKYGDREFNPGWTIKPVLTLVIGILIAIFQPYTLERVDAGHVGIKVKLSGDERGISDYQ